MGSVPASLPARPGGAVRDRILNAEGKRKRKNRERPKEKIELGNGWLLVITSWGRRFVHYTGTGESFWTVPEDVQKLIDEQDRDEIIKLIAKARGLRLDDDGNVAPRQPKQKEKEAPEPVEVDIGDRKVQIVEEEEDEEDVAEEDAERSQDESSDDDDDLGTGFNVQDLIGGGSDNEQGKPSISEEDVFAFESMLDEFDLNPMNAWEMERDKVLNDDRYDIYDSNRARSDAFAEWARKKIEAKKNPLKAGAVAWLTLAAIARRTRRGSGNSPLTNWMPAVNSWRLCQITTTPKSFTLILSASIARTPVLTLTWVTRTRSGSTATTHL
jgi:hypothetical protein